MGWLQPMAALSDSSDKESFKTIKNKKQKQKNIAVQYVFEMEIMISFSGSERYGWIFLDLHKGRSMRICSHAVVKTSILPVHWNQQKTKRLDVQYVLRVVRNIWNFRLIQVWSTCVLPFSFVELFADRRIHSGLQNRRCVNAVYAAFRPLDGGYGNVGLTCCQWQNKAQVSVIIKRVFRFLHTAQTMKRINRTNSFMLQKIGTKPWKYSIHSIERQYDKTNDAGRE